MNKGDTVYCRNRKDRIIRGWITYPITVGKAYIIYDIVNKHYCIENDRGKQSQIPIKKFFTLSELRETRLNLILEK